MREPSTLGAGLERPGGNRRATSRIALCALALAKICCLGEQGDASSVLFSALRGLWRYSLVTDKLSATMQIAKRVYSLAQEQNDSALMIGAYRALGVTSHFFGDLELGRQYTMRGIQIWRSEGVQSPFEEVTAPAVTCLVHEALFEWFFGEIACCQATMAEAISLAKDLNDMHALAIALLNAGFLGHLERNPTKVERLASDLIELSTRHQFASWMA